MLDMSGIRVPHPKWWTPVLFLQEKDSLNQTLNPKPQARSGADAGRRQVGARASPQEEG